MHAECGSTVYNLCEMKSSPSNPNLTISNVQVKNLTNKVSQMFVISLYRAECDGAA